VKKGIDSTLITPNEILGMVGGVIACGSKHNTKDVFDVSGLQIKMPELEDGYSLFLTNIRSFQQDSPLFDKKQEAIRQAKEKLKGKYFQIRPYPPTFCGGYRSAIFQGEDGMLKTVLVKNIPCNSWTCPDCCIRKALQTKYLLKKIIIDNDLNRFLTLTLKPSKIPTDFKDNTHKYITKLFNHFITVLKRKKFKYFDKKKKKYFNFDLKNSGEVLKYVWVVEYQKETGNAHLHIVFNQYLPIIVLRKIWVHVGGGHSMKIMKVKTIGGISSYITDYIVKGIKDDINANQGETKRSFFRYFQKRFSVSRSCIRDKKPDAKPFLKGRSFQEKLVYLNSMGLDPIYRHLNNLEYQGNIWVKKLS